MHHETLLYMWHRLPFEREAPAAGVHVRASSDARPRQEWIDDSRRPRHARRRPSRRSRSAGTTSFPRHERRRSRRSRSSASTSPTRSSSSSSTPAAISDRAVVASRKTGTGCSARAFRIRCSGSTGQGGGGNGGTNGYWRGMFERIPLPLAWPVYVSHAEAAAYARWRGARLPTEAEFQRAAFGSAGGRARASVGRARRRRPSTASSISRAGIRSRSAVIPAEPSAWGVEDLVGNGWEWTSTHVRAVSGISRDGVVSGILGGFLRRRTHRHEGRVAGDGGRASAADVSQLVPRPVPICLCDLSLRHDNAPAAGSSISRATSSTTSRSSRGSCRRAICTTRSARRCSKRSASCRGTASRAPSSACSSTHGRAILAQASADAVSTHRRARARQRRRSCATLIEAGRAARTPTTGPPASTSRRPRAPSDRCVRQRPRPGGQALAPLDDRRVRHQATYESGLARGRRRAGDAGRTLVAVSRLEHRQLRSAGRRRISADDPRARSRRGDSLLLGADLVEAGSASCCSPTTIRSASRRRSTATCWCASTASSAATSTSTPSVIARCGTRTNRASRCTWSAARSSACASRRRTRRDLRSEGDTIWTESSYKYDPDGARPRCSSGAGFRADRVAGPTSEERFLADARPGGVTPPTPFGG